MLNRRGFGEGESLLPTLKWQREKGKRISNGPADPLRRHLKSEEKREFVAEGKKGSPAPGPARLTDDVVEKVCPIPA